MAVEVLVQPMVFLDKQDWGRYIEATDGPERYVPWVDGQPHPASTYPRNPKPGDTFYTAVRALDGRKPIRTIR